MKAYKTIFCPYRYLKMHGINGWINLKASFSKPAKFYKSIGA